MRSFRIDLILLLLIVLIARPAQAASAQISSEFQPQERMLKYEITNSGGSPIVRIEIPHFHADSVEMPDGWDSKSTNLVVESVSEKPGVCTFTNTQPEAAIRPGTKQKFSVHLSLAPFDIGKGSVIVHYADGTSETIPGVTQSVAPSQTGLGIAVAIAAGALLIVYGMRRNRKPGKTPKRPMQDEVI